jgi:hypothetical protein
MTERRGSSGFWLEWGKEIRRHAGNERLPWTLRTRLREHARRAVARSTPGEDAVDVPHPAPNAEADEHVGRVPPARRSLSEGGRSAPAVSRPDDEGSGAANRHGSGAPARASHGPASGRRVLFVMLHPGFVRYFEGALHALAGAGYHVHVAFEINRAKLGEDVTARRLAAVSPNITCGAAPERVESVRQFLARGDRAAIRAGDAARWPTREETWESLATTVRLLQDYLRFFDPAFARADALRARAEKRVPRVYRALVSAAARLGAPGRATLSAALRASERTIPVPDAIDAFVREHDPHVLIVTPLIELGSQQVDYVKCARRRGVPSALAVASWDNLTSKGLVRVVPDRVIVWNEAQRTEAVSLHGVPTERVATTGAVAFDRWFDAQPACSREAFCRQVGLDAARPFVLYVGSSSFIAPDEVPFFERWLTSVRASSDPAVATAGVLVRPHPANARQWEAVAIASRSNVAVWPPIGTDPTAAGFWTDYFHSLHFSAAVVGINTSAQVEAAVVGRPVLTVRTPEFAHSQDGTLHFRHLVSGGGAVRAAASLPEHVQQLGEALARGVDVAANREFVTRFVRPRGLETPAARVFADVVGALAATPRAAERPDPAWVGAARPAALVAAFGARALAEDRPLWVYAARPFVSLGVHAAASGYRARDGWHRLQPVKRARRATWRAWYESWQATRKGVRRATKPVTRAMRQAGGAARRAIRRVP